MRVLIVYNHPVLPDGHVNAVSEHEIESTAAAVHGVLAAQGCDVDSLPIGRDLESLPAALRNRRPEVVFNLFEGHADRPDTESEVAAVIERLGLPFTGCRSETLRLARNKHLTKRLLLEAGLPTPRYLVVESLHDVDESLGWPVIVKPAGEDASIGIDQSSVVTSKPQLVRRVEYLLDKYGPAVLVEEFVSGRELNVAVVTAPNLRVLPVSEILFTGYDSGCWPIVTYDGKWTPGSPDYEATPPRYPAKLDARLAARVRYLALRAFRLLACTDYARVDFRVSPSAGPMILEVNPNPDFSPEACLAGSLASAGSTHAAFAMQLVKTAFERGSRRAAGGRRAQGASSAMGDAYG